MLFYVLAGNCKSTALGLPAIQTYLSLLLITSAVIYSRNSRSWRMSWFISCYLKVRPCGLGRIIRNWGLHQSRYWELYEDVYVYADINLYCSYNIYKEPTWCNFAVCLLVTAVILYVSTCFGRYLRPSLGALKNYSNSLWCMTCDGVKYPIRATKVDGFRHRPWTPLLDTSRRLTSYTRDCYYSF